MGFMREFPQYLKNRLEFEQFTPLIKSAVNVVGAPTTPAALGVTSARNTAVKCEYDKRSFIACYDRIAIASMFTTSMALKPVTITAQNVTRLRDLQPDIYRCLGIFPDPLEIADAAITLNGNTVAVPVDPNNPWFTGTLTLTLDTAYYTAADGTVIADMGTWDPRPFVHPTADPTTRPVVNGGLLTYNNDYSSQSGTLAGIPVRAGRVWADIATADATALAAALAAVDGIPWVNNTAGTASVLYDWNLFKASVIYNGPTEAFDPLFDAGFTNAIQQYFLNYDLVDTRYTHVLIVHPNPSYGNKNLRYAPLFIHYGRKRNDTELVTAYRKPRHSWSLLDSTDNGFLPMPFGYPATVFADTDMGSWGKFISTSTPVFPELLPADIDHTIAFEIMRTNVAVPYQNRLVNIGNAGEYNGSYPGAVYIDSAGKIGILGATTVWVRDGISNALTAGQIAEVHIVKRQSLCYIYINQQLCELVTVPLLTKNTYSTMGEGNASYPITEYIRNFRYWDIGLTRQQVESLNNDVSFLAEEPNPAPVNNPVYPADGYPKPVYEWLLQGDAKSTGIREDTLPGAWTFTDDGTGNKYAHLGGTTPVLFPPELRMRVCGDYTYDFEVDLANLPWGYIYFFTVSQSSKGLTGHLAYYDGRFYEYGVTPTGNNPDFASQAKYFGRVRFTLRCIGGTTSMYINGVLQRTYKGAALSSNIQWSGMRDLDGAAAQFPTIIGFRKMRYWSYGLSNEQLAGVWAD